ncbi:FG-GAP-like repeat-containing protein [Actinacidiphila acididurans]|uniref:VCBS repeat-containing protein n=1 Tax=Actinacidiphila acididurans TaxID=2784346 RepID=A0ABS2U1N0_9ACTN|nr:FG-GAP-like repeat-containing protein [Actinacidiphila acididurans]MBM9509101.1 VCBS repeat-containing protein [Actinacidiphila acididurans]
MPAKWRRSGAVAFAVGAMLAGIAGVGAQPASAQPAFPSWLVGFETEHGLGGPFRACSAIELSKVRELTSPDCFTGRTAGDYSTWYHGGTPDWGADTVRYETHPQYNAATRQTALAVTVASNPPVSYTTGNGRPVLATTADAALYSPGATATFYSWSGPTEEGVQRTAHTEQVAILSTATCTSVLGHTPPAGSLCTLPAKGAPVPDHADQCLGDAGGALMSGGKLIGVSATPSTGCVAASGVRLYVNVTAYHSVIGAWGHDVYADPWDSGSVTAQQPWSGGGFVSFCDIDGGGHLIGCQENGGAADFFDVQYNWLTQAGDLDGDGYGDLLARTPGGALYRYSGPLSGDFDTQRHTWLANGFGGYNAIFASTDFSGDGIPDVLARDAAGDLWLYRGTGKGGLQPRVHIGVGLRGYNLITGRGDLSGDGLADFIARDSAGTLWLFKGNGKGSYAGRVKLATGYAGYNRIVASGDIDHDGHPDLFATTPAGGAAVINVTNGTLSHPKWYASGGYQVFTHIN